MNRVPFLINTLAATVISQSVLSAEIFTLEEVVVTAQKRTESLHDVPISISALSGDKLSNAGIEKVEDLTAYVPNIHMTESGLSTQLRIRGIGSGNNQAFEQSVGQYVDGIYYGRQQLIRAPFLDLERVEVLRGPQSILFGKNSIAGAINYTTAKPSEEFEAEVSISHEFEASDATEITAVLSGAITDNLLGRLAVRDYEEDGYLQNVYTGDDSPSRDENAVRATLVWNDGGNLSVTFKAERDTFDTKGRQTEVVSDEGFSAILESLSAAGGIGFDSDLDYRRYADADEHSDNTLNNYTLTVEYELGNNTLTSVTGWADYEFSELCDCDFTASNILYMPAEEDYEQISQELRLMSPGGEKVDWIIGAFYQASDLQYNGDAVFADGGLLDNLGHPLGNNILARNYESESDAWAVFGQATLNLTDNFRFTLGARYTEETKKATRMLNLLEQDTGLPSSTAEAAIFASFNAVTEQYTGHNLTGDRDEKAFTPLLNVQWDVSSDVMLYAAASTGFKAGGFDTNSNIPSSWEFEEEQATAYEVGAKTILLDDTLELNIAYYYTDYEDLQTSQFDGGLGFTVGNAKETVVQGVEIDGRWAASENLTVIYAMAYNDFEFKDFRNGNCYFRQAPDGDVVNGQQLCDYTGSSSSYTPKKMANLSFDYRHPVNDALELRSTLDFQYVDNHNVHPNQDPLFNIDAYTTVNWRLGLNAEKWSVALLGKNLTDEKILTYANNIPLSGSSFGQGSYYGFDKRPRTLAVEARYHW